MKFSFRGRLIVGACAVAVAAMTTFTGSVQAQPATTQTPAATTPAAPAQPNPNQLTDDQLGQLLQAVGLVAKRSENRFDFTFKANVNEQEWNLSMSAVLSEDGRSIWVMAWLDELPKSAADVSRTSLLRLLALNDQLGNGKFFAYIPASRRFVLQRVVPNYKVSTAAFKWALQDLGESVVQSHGDWAVANWKETPGTPATTTPGTPATPASQTTPVKPKP